MRERGGVIGFLAVLILGSLLVIVLAFSVCVGDDEDGMGRVPEVSAPG